MYYNVDFFFEKPMRFFTSEEETPQSVSEEDYNKYISGQYIKGDDGTPKLKYEPVDYSDYSYETPTPEPPIIDEEPLPPQTSNEEVLSAIAELSEMVANLVGKENE